MTFAETCSVAHPHQLGRYNSLKSAAAESGVRGSQGLASFSSCKFQFQRHINLFPIQVIY